MDDLLINVLTIEDRDGLIFDIDEFEKANFLKNEGNKRVYENIDEGNLDILNRVVADNPNGSGLGLLKDKLMAMEVVKISISFEPSRNTIRDVCAWVRENFGQNTLTDFEVNRKIGAGAVVSYRGKYASFTIEDKLDDYLSKNKESLIQRMKLP